MTSTDAPAFTITEPGVYDMPEDVYHADPVPGGSLSASGAKKLLQCPARFQYDQYSPPAPTASMEFGTAVHKFVLGIGAQVVKIDEKNWRTDAARKQGAEARAAGHVPLLAADYQRAEDVAAAVLAHPIAGALFAPETGRPEQSIFWVDPVWGIWRRSRLDWLRHPWMAPQVIPDLKTCSDAHPDAIAKAVANFGYHIQGAQYTDAVMAMGLADAEPPFLLAFAETSPPHLVTVAQLDDNAVAAGRRQLAEACERFRDCRAVDIWPGYTDDIALISLPAWARTREDY